MNRHPDANVRELAQAVARLTQQFTGTPRPTLESHHWLSISELAALCGKTTKTVRRWVRDHGLPAKKLPGDRSGHLVRYGDFVSWRTGEGDEVGQEILNDVIRRLDQRAS